MRYKLSIYLLIVIFVASVGIAESYTFVEEEDGSETTTLSFSYDYEPSGELYSYVDMSWDTVLESLENTVLDKLIKRMCHALSRWDKLTISEKTNMATVRDLFIKTSAEIAITNTTSVALGENIDFISEVLSAFVKYHKTNTTTNSKVFSGINQAEILLDKFDKWENSNTLDKHNIVSLYHAFLRRYLDNLQLSSRKPVTQIELLNLVSEYMMCRQNPQEYMCFLFMGMEDCQP